MDDEDDEDDNDHTAFGSLLDVVFCKVLDDDEYEMDPWMCTCMPTFALRSMCCIQCSAWISCVWLVMMIHV